MQMIRMVTTSEHVYAGHRLHAGDEFDCEPQHVELMQKLGRARRKEAQSYMTRDMTAVAPFSRTSISPRRSRRLKK